MGTGHIRNQHNWDVIIDHTIVGLACERCEVIPGQVHIMFVDFLY